VQAGMLGRRWDEYAGRGMGNGAIRIGVLTPHGAIGPEAEFPAMAPGRIVTRVARVSAGAAAAGAPADPPPPFAAAALTEPPLLDDAANILAADCDAIGYASTSSAYAIGPAAEAALVRRLRQRSGIPVEATCASAVRALRVLDVNRLALVEPPWFDDELNELGAAYFRRQHVQVVWTASADLSRDPGQIEPAAVYEWTSRQVPDDAEAVFIGGNGFLAAGAIEALEATLRRPVLTSNQVLLWSLLAHAATRLEVGGYGQLFAHRPPPDDP
jgi:maleate isomerase